MLVQRRKARERQKRLNARDAMRRDSVASRRAFWLRVDRADRRATRRQRTREKHKQIKAQKMACRQSLTCNQRYRRYLLQDYHDTQKRSQRRAVLIHPDGTVSPMKLLPATKHPHGVLGSLLGGKPSVLASCPNTGVALMGLQDTVCDDEWKPPAYELLQCINVKKGVADIYGIALCVRLCQHKPTGLIYLGDLPLTTFTTGACSHVVYARQREASYEVGDKASSDSPPSDKDSSSDDDDDCPST